MICITDFVMRLCFTVVALMLLSILGLPAINIMVVVGVANFFFQCKLCHIILLSYTFLRHKFVQ